jgi:serine/threonine protein phosphatase PrpC
MVIENLDAYFTIARQHLICEDYAFCAFEPIPHIVLCDGCSSSSDTDVGARILAASASKTIREHFEKAPHDPLPSYTDFGYAAANRARHVIEMLGLPVNALDATLLVAIPYHRKIHVYVYGDGYILTRDLEGNVGSMQLSFARNMPYYVSYWIDKSRRKNYAAITADDTAVLTIRETQGGQECIRQADYDEPLVFPFNIDAFSAVALASDGVYSFMSIEGQQKIPAHTVIEQLMAYKTTKGDFVKRRVRRMLKTYGIEGIYPTDDLAVATLLIDQ